MAIIDETRIESFPRKDGKGGWRVLIPRGDDGAMVDNFLTAGEGLDPSYAREIAARIALTFLRAGSLVQAVIVDEAGEITGELSLEDLVVEPLRRIEVQYWLSESGDYRFRMISPDNGEKMGLGTDGGPMDRVYDRAAILVNTLRRGGCECGPPVLVDSSGVALAETDAEGEPLAEARLPDPGDEGRVAGVSKAAGPDPMGTFADALDGSELLSERAGIGEDLADDDDDNAAGEAVLA